MTPASWTRRPQRATGIVSALVVAPLLAVGLVAWLIDPVPFVNRQLGRVEELARQQLGRKLTLGTVEGHFFPTLHVVISGVELSGAAPGDEPMLSLPRVEIRFRVARALLTLGRELPLEAVRVDGGVLRIRRDLDGNIDLLDVMKKLPPLDPADLEGGVLNELWIDGGQLVLIDEGLGRQVALRDVHVETTGPAALGAPLAVTASASWADGPPARVEVHVAEVPTDLVFWPPPPASARLDARAVDLAGATAWLELPPLFSGGQVDVALEVVADAAAVRGALDVQGRGISAVVTTGAGAGVEQEGVETDARLQTKVALEVATMRAVVDSLSFTGAGLTIEGAGALRDASLDGIESLDVNIVAEELARLGSVIPALRDVSPGAFRLAGHGQARVKATAEGVLVDLELDGARVKIGEAVDKRPGDRLRVHLEGERNHGVGGSVPMAGDAPFADDAATEVSAPGRMDTRVVAELPDGVTIHGDIALQPSGVDIALFDLRTSSVALASATALSPVLRDLLQGNTRGGRVVTSLVGRMSAEDTDWNLGLRASDVTLAVETSTFHGDADVRFRIGTSTRGLALGLHADLSQMSIVTLAKGTSDDKKLFDKRAASAFTVSAALREAGGPGSLGHALEGLDAAADGGKIFVGSGLTPRWRSIVLGLTGAGSVRAEHVRLAGISLDDAVLAVTLRAGRLRVERSSVEVLTGRATLAGSEVDLRAKPPTWALSAAVADVDLATLLAPLHAVTGDVSGALSVAGNLRGSGLSIEAVLSSLDGPVTVQTKGVRIAAVDFLTDSATKVWRLLAVLPGVSARDLEMTRGKTLAATIADHVWTLRFHGNQLRFDDPVTVETNMGVLSLAGHAALDSTIAFTAKLDLLPTVVNDLQLQGATEATAKTTEPLVVEMSVTGTWAKPVVGSANVDRLLQALKMKLERSMNERILDPLRAAASRVNDDVTREVDRTQAQFDRWLGKEPDPPAISTEQQPPPPPSP